jgi:beta-lactamase superfamily II metal-dependent hydrolase
MAEVLVRMYNVGFGDCFLVEFPRDDGTAYRVLVDCGSHSAGHPGKGWKISKIVSHIVSDLDGSPIDVVVASHRHQDHVSGFDDPGWKTVTVGEVWMPWTENPDDREATRIRNRQSSLALNLSNAFASPEFGARWAATETPAALQAMVTNSLTNEAAMRTLHHGFAGRPERRFLSTASTSRIKPERCPGLTVHLLGPSRDEAVMRDMDPPSGQSYLRFQAGAAPAPEELRHESAFSEAQQPFSGSFVVPAMTLADTGNDRVIKDAAAGIMRDTDLATAVSLDKAVNGTSLMLMFEFGSAYLLFPGDAQWGTWNAVMSNRASRELVSRTTFYKVGHHGSHNATPKEFLDEVLDPGHKMWGSAASVRPISFWPEIPRAPLMKSLAGHSSRVIRSDKPGRSRAGVGVPKGGDVVLFHVPC